MTAREGNLQAPTRHPLDWKNPDFYNEASLFQELEREFDIAMVAAVVFRCVRHFRRFLIWWTSRPRWKLTGLASRIIGR